MRYLDPRFPRQLVAHSLKWVAFNALVVGSAIVFFLGLRDVVVAAKGLIR